MLPRGVVSPAEPITSAHARVEAGELSTPPADKGMFSFSLDYLSLSSAVCFCYITCALPEVVGIFPAGQ